MLRDSKGKRFNVSQLVSDTVQRGVELRRARERQARREQILSAATRCFLRRGLQATTVDEIAQAAELGKGTLYHYFHSKEEIYVSIMERYLDHFYQEREAVFTSGKSPHESLAQVWEVMLRQALEHPEFSELSGGTSHGQRAPLSEELKSRIRQKLKQNSRLLARGFEEGQKAGLFIVEDPEELARVFMALFHGLLRTRWNVSEEEFFQRGRSAFRIFLRGIEKPKTKAE